MRQFYLVDVKDFPNLELKSKSMNEIKTDSILKKSETLTPEMVTELLAKYNQIKSSDLPSQSDQSPVNNISEKSSSNSPSPLVNFDRIMETLPHTKKSAGKELLGFLNENKLVEILNENYIKVKDGEIVGILPLIRSFIIKNANITNQASAVKTLYPHIPQRFKINSKLDKEADITENIGGSKPCKKWIYL